MLRGVKGSQLSHMEQSEYCSGRKDSGAGMVSAARLHSLGNMASCSSNKHIRIYYSLAYEHYGSARSLRLQSAACPHQACMTGSMPGFIPI